MARAAITAYPMPLGAHTADPTPDAIDAANGMVLTDVNPSRILLRIKNTFAGAKDITIGIGVNPPASVAAANLASYMQNAVKWVWAAPGARHAQADGATINVDFEAGTTGEITAFILPLGL